MLTLLPRPSLLAVTPATVTLTMTCPENGGRDKGGQEEHKSDLDIFLIILKIHLSYYDFTMKNYELHVAHYQRSINQFTESLP